MWRDYCVKDSNDCTKDCEKCHYKRKQCQSCGNIVIEDQDKCDNCGMVIEWKKKSFLICPVRGHSMEETSELVSQLEKDYDVHWPPRDTDQDDESGLRICRDNAKAIQEADVIHVVWDGTSQGCLFDLGMAFMLKKQIIPIRLPDLTNGKSFQNMITQLHDEQMGA